MASLYDALYSTDSSAITLPKFSLFLITKIIKKKKAEHSIVLPLVVGERVDFSSLNLIEFNHHCCGVFLQFL